VANIASPEAEPQMIKNRARKPRRDGDPPHAVKKAASLSMRVDDSGRLIKAAVRIVDKA